MSPDELYDKMETFFIDSEHEGIEAEKLVEISQNIKDLMKQSFAEFEQSADKQQEFEQYDWYRQFRDLMSVCPAMEQYVSGSDFVCFFRRIDEIESENPKSDLFRLALVCAAKISVVLRAIAENDLPQN